MPQPACSLFRAFADPIRLRLLALLQDGELCVGDLVEVLRAPQPTISRHLACLRSAGLVRSREEGTWRFYRLARPGGSLHRKLLACLKGCLREMPEVRRDAARAARRAGRECSCPR